jgi:hypothetical protein
VNGRRRGRSREDAVKPSLTYISLFVRFPVIKIINTAARPYKPVGGICKIHEGPGLGYLRQHSSSAIFRCVRMETLKN